jgi:hypothetical protein
MLIAGLGFVLAVAVAATVLVTPTRVQGTDCGRALFNRGSGPGVFNDVPPTLTCHGQLVRNEALAGAALTLAACLAAIALIEHRGRVGPARGRRTLEVGLVAASFSVGGLVVAASRPESCAPAPGWAWLGWLIAPLIGAIAVFRALNTDQGNRPTMIGLVLGLSPFAVLAGLWLDLVPFLQHVVTHCGA